MQEVQSVADGGQKAKIVIRYKGKDETDVMKTFVLSHKDKSQIESLLRIAFHIPESEDMFVLIDEDTFCYPVKNLDVYEASRSKSLVLQTLPRNSNKPDVETAAAVSLHLDKLRKDDKRKNNRGLDQRRSYSKAEKILAMLLKDMGKSAEEIATISTVSKSNVEKWCADKTREAVLGKYRQTCHERALLDVLPPGAVHFVLPSHAHALAAARVLLDQLHQLALSSPLLAWEDVLWADGSRGRDAPEATQADPSSRKRARLESEDSELSGLPREPPSADKYVAHLLSSLTAVQPRVRRPSPHDEDDGDSVEDDVQLLRSVAARMQPRRLPGQEMSRQTEDWVMQYNMPLRWEGAAEDLLATSAEVPATRPLLTNTRFLTDMRAQLKRKVPTAEEEEDRRILSLLGE